MFNQHMNIHTSIILINKVYIIHVISRIDCLLTVDDVGKIYLLDVVITLWQNLPACAWEYECTLDMHLTTNVLGASTPSP